MTPVAGSFVPSAADVIELHPSLRALATTSRLNMTRSSRIARFLRNAAAVCMLIPATTATSRAADNDSTSAVIRAGGGSVLLDVRSADARDVMLEICRQTGARLYWDPAIRRSVTLHADGMPLERLLPRVLGPANFAVVWHPDPDIPGAYRPAEIRVYRDGRQELAVLAFEAPKTTSDDAELAAILAEGTNAIPRLAGDLTATGDVRRCTLAARALAALGTPEAITPLFALLGTLPAGDMADHLARIAGGITNAASARMLSVYLLSTDRPLVADAAARSLGATADSDLLRELQRVHGSDPSSQGYTRLCAAVTSASTKAAEPALSGFAGPLDRAPADPLARAAVTALSRVGSATATDQIVERLNSVPEGSTAELDAAVASTAPTPEGLASLRYAAAGSKAASRDSTRTAAIRGLMRFPDGETVTLLRQLKSDPSPAVRSEASRALQFLEPDNP